MQNEVIDSPIVVGRMNSSIPGKFWNSPELLLSVLMMISSSDVYLKISATLSQVKTC